MHQTSRVRNIPYQPLLLMFSIDQFYRERYLQASRDQEQLRKKILSQAEEEVEEIQNQKRQLERRVSDGEFLLLSCGNSSIISRVQYLLSSSLFCL